MVNQCWVVMEEIGERERDNGREGRIIYIDLTYQTHLSFISLEMMTHFVYSSIFFLLFFIVNEAKKPDDPLQGLSKKLLAIFFFSSYHHLCYI